MKINRPALACLAVLAVIGNTAVSASAQHIGFQIAIAPAVPTINQPIVVPGFSQPMIVPFTGQSTFGFPPTQPPAIVTRPKFHHGNTIVVVQQIPQTCCVWQPQVMIPGQVFTPGAVIVSQPQAFFGPPIAQTIQAGTPRAQVLVQLGRPSVTIVTSTGETMHFNGGVTVIIQNGQVITGPR